MMNARISGWCRCALVGAAVVTLLVSGRAMYAAPRGTTQTPQKQKALENATSPSTIGMVRLGPGLGNFKGMPIYPVVMAYPSNIMVTMTDGRSIAPLSYASSSDRPAQASAAGGTCITESDCDDCLPCTRDLCIFSGGVGTCTHNPEAAGDIGDCTDGLFCNGQETCDANQDCVPGIAPCVAGQTCSEDSGSLSAGECLPTCTTNGDCSDDGLLCNGAEICEIVGGGPDGFCTHEGNVCGTGSSCAEPVDQEIVVTCGVGRCCVVDAQEDTGYLCSRDTQADCTGLWLGIGDDDDTCDERPEVDNPDDFQCPFYSSGVTPENITGLVGPVDVAGCDGLTSIGDDYGLAGAVAGAAATDWIEVTVFRWVGGAVKGTGLRPRIAFYDGDGVLIVDTITNFESDPEPGLRTVSFSESPIIPANGFWAIFPAAEFAPDQRILVATTDAVEVGTNDPLKMWANGQIILAANPGPSGTPIAGERTLAFEIIGNITSRPDGACCDSASPACTEELPWVCEETLGNTFQGVGVRCNSCSNGFGFEDCEEDIDCPPTCDNDGNIVCELGGTDCPGGNCVAGLATCNPVLPACTVGACCDDESGVCIDSTTGDAGCTAPEDFQGFGTDCNPNCCEQFEPSGGDTCAKAPIHLIEVPPFGDPPRSYTFTGDNRLANPGLCSNNDNQGCSSDADCTGGTCKFDYPDDCSAGFFNTAAPLGARDPGYWEAFTTTACANIRLDFCCTEPVLQPSWAFMTDACPCNPTFIGNTIVGTGVGTDLAANDRGAPFCASDNLWQTYGPLVAGVYYFPVFSGPDGIRTQYQFHIVVEACPLRACCVGESCEVLNEIECREAGGHWLDEDNVGQNIVDCGLVPEDNPCRFGSCCTGPGVCVDEVIPDTPCDPANIGLTCQNQANCDAEPGVYVGGSLCDTPVSPCPVCEFENPTNCQLLDDAIDSSIAGVSDLSAPGGPLLRADDFVTTGSTITAVCFWGAYQDTTDPDGDGTMECVDVQPDRFRVQIYVDADGRPGALLPDSTRTAGTLNRGLRQDSGYHNFFPATFGEAYSYQLEFDVPITVPPDTRLWLEIANDTGADIEAGEEPNFCAWAWLTAATAGNGVSWSGVDDGAGTGVYGGQQAKPLDMAMCISSGIDTLPDPTPEPCCTCPNEGATCSEIPFNVCIATRDRWNADAVNCAGAGCDEAIPGDDGATDMIEVTGDQVSVPFDTSCATVDGAATIPSEFSPITMGPDIWVAYTAPCTGRVIGSMCNVESEYDSALAVYHDTSNPTVCTFPGTSVATLSGVANDEACNGQGDGGAGWLSRVTLNGNCWLFRIGAYGLDSGPGRLDIQCLGQDCTPSQAPVLPLLAVNQQNPPGLAPDIANRYLALEFAEAGQKAIRITLTSLPPPYDIWNGQSMFVGAPGSVTENGGVVNPIPGFDNFPVSTLTCGVPHFTDWQALGTIYITHEAIRPGGTYSVQMIDETCSLAVESNFSDALEFSNAIFGDTVRDTSFSPPPPPDGSVAIIDIFAMIGAFQSSDGAIRKYRADLEPKCPDLKVNITDILEGIGALQGLKPANSAPDDADVCLSGCTIILGPLLP